MGYRQARLRDIVREKNLCGDASNGDSSGRHGGFVRRRFWRCSLRVVETAVLVCVRDKEETIWVATILEHE